jgi:hypothetical protein
MTKPLIIVGTPCYGGLVNQDYTVSLLNLTTAAREMNIDLAVILLGNDALITRGRASLVAKFLDVPTATHLLFIDADIAFSPDMVWRMLHFDKDFIGGLYPIKNIDWPGMAQRFHPQGETLEQAGLMYVGDVCKGADLKTDSGFATGTYVGTGFQLIKRHVFEKMIAAYPETKFNSIHAYPPQKTSDNLYALFDCMIDPETGAYLSEDFAFCRRWRALGGEIWLDLTSKLTHIGPCAYHGNAAARYFGNTTKR